MSDQTPTDDAPSRPRQRFRRTRIAVSVFFGLLTLSLCVLWVRSYRWHDGISGPLATSKLLEMVVFRGVLFLSVEGAPYSEWQWSSAKLEPKGKAYLPRWRFAWISTSPTQSGFALWLPLWFPSVVCFVLATIPWLRRRFSLRTMLIATTLVAVVLGLVVWTVR